MFNTVTRRVVPIAALLLAAATGGGGSTAAASPGAQVDADPHRGLVHTGLDQASDGPCAGGWRLEVAAQVDLCTHGPDAAPEGVDVTRLDNSAGSTTATTTTATIPCIGDGTSGRRVQVIYAVASDQPDNYLQSLELIGTIAGRMNDAVLASASATGGARYIRFATNPDCSLNIAKVILSPTGDDTFSNTVSELRAKGYTSSSRKYLVMMDALVYCGIGQMLGDDRPGLDNSANTSGGIARVDRSCWGLSNHLTELHELMHTMGAVQPSAPHATALNHCTDESDTMCYQDSPDVVMSYPCASTDEWLLDCGHDDYFSTAPPAGSYLASHWNVANIEFLSPTLDDTTAAPGPTPSVSETFTGSVSSKRPTRSFSVTTGAGQMSSELAFSSSGKSRTLPQMTLVLVAADGSVVASGSGPSILRSAVAVASGTYRLDVSSASSLSFTLTVTHPQG